MFKTFSATKNLRVVWLSALLFIAIVAVLNFFVLWQLTVGQERNSLIINLSGRQRMLAQRIALYATRLVNEDNRSQQETLSAELTLAIDEMQAAYEVLQAETRSPAVLTIYVEAPHELNVRLPLFMRTAQRIASAPSESLTPMLGDYQSLLNAMPALVQGLEAAVWQRQHEDLNSIYEVERAQLATLVITLAAVAGIAVFIFLPIEKRIRQEDASLRFEIAERKRAEAALRDSQLVYEQFASQMPKAAIFMFDLDMRYTFAEGPYLRQMGFTPESFKGKLAQDVLPTASLPALLPYYEAALRGEEVDFVRESPTFAYQSTIAPLRNNEGDIIGGMLLSLDIWSKRQAEKALQENQERLRLVTNNVLDIVFLYEKDDTVGYLSPSFERVLGFKPEDFIGESLETLIYSDDFGPTIDAYRHAIINKNATLNLETRLLDSKGKPVWFEVAGSLLYDEAEKYDGAVFVMRDSTERYAMEELMVETEGLRVALEKEQELNDLKTGMMVRVAHEFRTPLAIINLSNDMLSRYYQRMTDEKREEQINQIRTQVGHITDMLKNITFVVRPQDENVTRLLVSIDMAQLCSTKIAEIVELGYAGREIKLQTDDESYDVMQDGELLSLVVENALSNALKFSTGSVQLSLARDLVGKTITLKVQDYGMGIPASEVSRLSESFFRASNIGEVPGLGLGMTILARSLEQMGGTWHIESELGKGTMLTIDIPERRRQTGSLNYVAPVAELA